MPVFVVDADAAVQSLAPSLLVIPDDGRDLDPLAVAQGDYDVDARHFSRMPPNLGYPHHAWWVRMRLSNPTELPLHRLLVLWRGATQEQLVRIEAPGLQQTVALGHGADRIGDVKSRHQVLRITLRPHQTTTITTRVQSRVALVMDYRLMTGTALAKAEALDYGYFGILLGAVASIGLFVLAIWLGMRERIYLWFCGFSFGILIYQLHAEGYVYMLLGPRWQVSGSYIAAFSGAFHSMALVMLVRDYTITPTSAARLDRWVVGPLIALLALTFPLFFVRPWLGNSTVAIGTIVSGMTLMALLALHLIRGRSQVRGFFIALFLYWVAGVLYMMKRIGVIADLPEYAYAQQLTTVLAVLMFAIAISQRVRAIAQENRDNQTRYAQRLEHDVAERTRQYREAKEIAERTLDQLQQAQRQLVRSEKMASLGQLVAGVAHEVNTPLGVALTASSHLGERSQAVAARLHSGQLQRSDLHEYIGTAEASSTMIERNLARAAHLISSFKQVSVDRTSDGRRRFDLRIYITELIDSLAVTWKGRPISLTVDCAPGLKLDSFPGAFGQVLSNLIQNALLHAFEPDQPGTMHVAVRELDDRYLEIAFVDDGKGARPEVIAHLFEPFFTTRRNQGGTGLGLHVAFNLVEQKLGGTIQVAGALGTGLCFRLRVPRVAPGDAL